MRNVTTSMLHTTTTPHKAMLHAAATPLKPLAQPQSEFNLQFLPPLRSESERDLRRLIDECVEEKERVETGGYLTGSRSFGFIIGSGIIMSLSRVACSPIMRAYTFA